MCRAWIIYILILVAHCASAEPESSRIPGRIIERQRTTVDEPSTQRVLGGKQVSIWLPKTSKPSPLIVFSHGFHGCSTQSRFLTGSLAQNGYVVIAPDHSDALCGQNRVRGLSSLAANPKFRDLDSWNDRSYYDRYLDMRAVIDAARNDSQLKGLIDWSRIGLAGHSLGGYTVLGLAGAWKSWALPEIKAVLALSPFCQPFIKQDTLRNITVPTMYQGGTRDYGITPAVERQGGAFDQMRSTAYYVKIDDAGHFAWADFKSDHHKTIAAYAVAFFDKHLSQKDTGLLNSKMSDVSVIKSKP